MASNYRDSDSFRSFSLLKAIAIRLPLLFANARVKTIAVAIVGKAITIWEAIQKRSHEPIYKTLINLIKTINLTKKKVTFSKTFTRKILFNSLRNCKETKK